MTVMIPLAAESSMRGSFSNNNQGSDRARPVSSLASVGVDPSFMRRNTRRYLSCCRGVRLEHRSQEVFEMIAATHRLRNPDPSADKGQNRQQHPTPMHVPDFRPDMAQIRACQYPEQTDQRQQIGADDKCPLPELSLAFGPRAGGLFLAFPAILAASLTLIAKKEDTADAREDARGAVAGAVALACFAAVGAALFGVLAGGAVLALASVVWTLVAVTIYFVAWRPS